MVASSYRLGAERPLCVMGEQDIIEHRSEPSTADPRAVLSPSCHTGPTVPPEFAELEDRVSLS